MSKSDDRWIIATRSFREHDTFDKMQTELARLKAANPKLTFRTYRIKRTIGDHGRVFDFSDGGLRHFLNCAKILLSIDQAELTKAGIESMRDDMAWRSFMGNPIRWAMHASDEDAAKLWTIVEARSVRTPSAGTAAPPPPEPTTVSKGGLPRFGGTA